MCLITRDEPLLEQALRCVRPHVEELIVVVTCASDTESIATAKACGADRVEVFEGCNDVPGPEGLMADFSAARNYSFSLATRPWIGWMDADDTVEGLERLPHVLNLGQLARSAGSEVCLQFPYEYGYDDHGKCICLQTRERIVSSAKAFRWMNRCHEVIPSVVANAVVLPEMREVVWKHQRHKTVRPAPWAPNTPYPANYYVHHAGRRFKSTRGHTSGTEPPTGNGNEFWTFYRREDIDRNLRILTKMHEEQPEDARTLYYYGSALTDCGKFDEAIPVFTKYVEVGGWEDERMQACLRVSNIYLGKQDWSQAAIWALRGVMTKENWSEGYLYLCRIFYFFAKATTGEQSRRNWERCVHFGKIGLSLPPTQTGLFVNPVEREYEVHEWLNFAKSQIGDTRGALESAQEALKVRPDNTNLQLNKLIYEEFLAKADCIEALHRLKGAATEIVRKFNLARSSTNDVGELGGLYDLLEKAIDNPAMVRERIRENGFSVPSIKKGLDIVIACGDCWEEWSPVTAAEKGIGGSETAVIEMGKRLVSRGHRVRVFTSAVVGSYDGVEYKKTAELPGVGQCDVLICWRHASLIDCCQAMVKLLWVHDVWAMGATTDNLLKFDRIFALSHWHKSFLVDYHLRQGHNIDASRVFVTRNGIDLARFDQEVPRDPHKVVHSSSPDRALESLLIMWPRIKLAVPEATLEVFYGFDNWEKMAVQSQDAPALLRISRIKGSFDVVKHMGVTYHGRVDQKTLARAFLSAGVWLSPTWFTETNCISAAEAHAAGLAMVTSPIAALNETVGDRGVMVSGDWLSDDYQSRFVVAATDALLHTTDEKRRSLQEYARNNFSWDGVVQQWEALFVELLMGRAKALETNGVAHAAPVAAAPPSPVDETAYQGVL